MVASRYQGRAPLLNLETYGGQLLDLHIPWKMHAVIVGEMLFVIARETFRWRAFVIGQMPQHLHNS